MNKVYILEIEYREGDEIFAFDCPKKAFDVMIEDAKIKNFELYDEDENRILSWNGEDMLLVCSGAYLLYRLNSLEVK